MKAPLTLMSLIRELSALMPTLTPSTGLQR
jgi:hypothetical protein